MARAAAKAAVESRKAAVEARPEVWNGLYREYIGYIFGV